MLPLQGPASLDIVDVTGRRVRHVDVIPQGGYVWDGRNAEGRLVRTGVYLMRVVTPDGTWQARSCVLR